MEQNRKQDRKDDFQPENDIMDQEGNQPNQKSVLKRRIRNLTVLAAACYVLLLLADGIPANIVTVALGFVCMGIILAGFLMK